ncbi:MAG: ABC transporter permease [Chloroflexota bacterium]
MTGMSETRADISMTAVREPGRRSWLSDIGTRLLKNRGAVISLTVIILLLLISVFAPLVAPYSPIQVDVANTLAPPSFTHLFGTDTIGRDILSRIIYGARLTIVVGVLAIFLAVLIGLPLGMVSGYYGSWTDRIISRSMDIMLAFPGILLALAVVAVLGSNVTNVTIAVGISLIPAFVRLVRGSFLTAREHAYVMAAQTLGASDGRIMLRHILPNVFAPLMVLATVGTAWAIIIGASLSFLGLGAQAPTPEWGSDLSSGREWLRTAWWISTFPGIAITVFIIAINLLGDGLRDALDPRLRNR